MLGDLAIACIALGALCLLAALREWLYNGRGRWVGARRARLAHILLGFPERPRIRK